MGFGFVFITLGVIAGSTWAFIESGTSWIGEPKIAISLVTWAVLSGHGFPARDRRMARAQGRVHGAYRAGLLRADLGRPRGLGPDRSYDEILITGVNHRSAPVEVRERLAFDEV